MKQNRPFPSLPRQAARFISAKPCIPVNSALSSIAAVDMPADVCSWTALSPSLMALVRLRIPVGRLTRMHRNGSRMRGHQYLAVLLLVCTAPGCIHMHPTRSGFLADYSQLEPVDKKARLQVKAVDAAALANVDSFYIEPVAWLADDMGLPANNEDAAEEIGNSLHESLAKELACIRPVVDEIGPGTAVVRSAVTGVRESLPIMNLILTFQ